MTQAALHTPSANVFSGPARPLLVGLGLGAFTEALFHGASMGANYTLFVVALVALVLGATPETRRRATRPRIAFTAALAVLTSSAMVLRASAWSAAFAVPLSASLVALLPVLLAGEDSALASDVGRALRSPIELPGAAEELAGEVAPLFGAGGRKTLLRIFLGLVVGAPVAGGFALLFAFDPRFTGTLDHVFARASGTLSVALWGLVSGSALVLAHRMLRRREPSAPPSRAELPYRQPDDAAAPAASASPLVSPLTWSVIVAQTAAVFLLYAGVNARAWFAGHGAIANPGETYASYLHAGFVQLLVAATLSIGMVLLGHVLLRPYGVRDHGAVPGGARLAALEIALLGGTALALGSCAERLAIYVEAYGATYERLAVGAVCVFVGFVVVLTIAKCARRTRWSYASALLGGAAVIGAACALFDADGTIAKVNVDRAAHGEHLDTSYLSGLSCDARPVLADPSLSASARADLDLAWQPSFDDVRSTRGVLACGR